MAINVTQKDEMLHEIIAWAEQSRKIALHSANRGRLEHADARVSWEEGRVSAFDDVVAHCKGHARLLRVDAVGSRESERGREMNTDADVRSLLKDIFGHDFCTYM